MALGSDEAGSPDTPKPGRPRLLATAYERELTRLAGVATTHGAHARHYAALAAQALFALDQPGWVPRDAAFAHFVKRNGDLKWSMLSELGRLPDAETVRAVAQLVGQQRLPTAEAVALVRRLRIREGRAQETPLPGMTQAAAWQREE
jgi:hypothetical protein